MNLAAASLIFTGFGLVAEIDSDRVDVTLSVHSLVIIYYGLNVFPSSFSTFRGYSSYILIKLFDFCSEVEQPLLQICLIPLGL